MTATDLSFSQLFSTLPIPLTRFFVALAALTDPVLVLPSPTTYPAGLTEREVEVLRLLV